MAYTPESGDVGFYLRATVTYNDGEGEGKSAMATSAHTVQAINLPNAAPVFPDQDPDTSGDQSDTATRMVEENTDAGEDVGLPVEADDADNDILTYTLGGADADDFDIEPATGQILTESDLDFDTTPSYTVMVTATDPGGATDDITVTITVTDVNETPEITGDVEDYEENDTGNVASFTATDPEGASPVPTLDLSGADASLFTLTNGELTFNESPNFEDAKDADGDNTYELTVGARDADGNRGTEDIEVKVTNVDEPGTVTLSAVQPRVGVAVTASLTDIDGAVSGVTWQWSNNGADIEDATSDTYTPTADEVGDTLRATAMYTDPQGPEKTAIGNSTNVVAADTRNKAPVFDDQDTEEDGTQNTEATRTVAENTVAPNPVGGGAVTATDPNTDALQDTVSYRLGGADASSFDIGLTTGQITVGTGTELDYETKDTYMVTVIATDSYGESSSIAVTINVTDENEGPEITGEDSVDYAERGEGPVVTFSATDPESAGAIAWSLLETDAGDFVAGDFEDFEIGETSGVLTFAEVPDYEDSVDGDNNNEYLVTVVATDADSMATNEAVTVTVTNVDEDGTVTLSAVAPYPGVELTATHADPDGQIAGAEWQWSRSRSKTSSNYTDIEDAEAVAYTPESGDVGFYLRATVTYNDGEGEGKSAMATSAHTVQAINLPNAAPVFPDQDPDTSGDQSDTATRMVEENTDAGEDVGLPVEADDADNDILTYTLGGADADDFDIEPATGQILTESDLDFDTTPSYTVMVTATDPGGATDDITVTITVTDVNETPEITGDVEDYEENVTGNVASFTATDPEGASPVPTLDLSGADASLFTLTNGELTFNESPNFEDAKDADGDNTYELTVGARDADGNRGTEDIEVKVTNVDEPGTVTLSAVQPRVGVAVTASLTDIDGAVSGVTWQWSNNGADIEDATSDTYTPTADEVGDTLRATAMYTDPQGPEKTAIGNSTNVVAADTRNKAPVFDDQDTEEDGTQNTEATRTVAENTVAPNPVGGGAVTATDPNTDALQDTVSYRLGGADASSFDIGLTTGQITVGTGTELDYETKDTYMVTVIATDSYGESSSIAVTINVTAVNEGPVITRADSITPNRAPTFPSASASRSIPENTPAGENIGAPVEADDPDEDSLTYTLEGTDVASFDINAGTGQLLTKAPLDREDKSTYMVVVKAEDPDGLSATISVEITVTDVDENQVPEFPFPTVQREVDENTSAEANIGVPVVATDGDSDVLSYALGGADMADFAIDTATGQLKTKSALDFETKSTYTVTVTASDGNGGHADTTVTIMVTNVDEDGEVRLSSAQASVGTAITATLSDPDGTVSGEAWQWERAATEDGTYAAISGATAASYTPVDADADMYLRATVDYTDGHGAGKSAMSSPAMVPAAASGTLLERYDADDSGAIEKSEMIMAINDYLFGTGADAISKVDMIEVINLYLFG